MRVITNIDGETYETIKELVEAGEYDSVDQFLRLATDNQLALEEVTKESSDENRPTSNTAVATQWQATKTLAASETHSWGYSIPRTIPTEESFAIDRGNRLLFSQYYRFLPLVFVLAELANKTADTNEPVDLDQFRTHIETAVTPVRDALVEWEQDHNVKQHERVSTGFPSADTKNPSRSLQRYLDHYVGQFQFEKGEPAGFPHQLGFVSIQIEDGSPVIALSPSGERFIRYRNPMLAYGPEESDQTLSGDEQAYVVTHIRANLGTEFDFMSYVYDTLVKEGPRYTQHLDTFESYLAQVDTFTDDPTENRVRSHTAGAISRMVDLGVLERGRRRGHYEGVRPPTAFEMPEPPAQLEQQP